MGSAVSKTKVKGGSGHIWMLLMTVFLLIVAFAASIVASTAIYVALTRDQCAITNIKIHKVKT